MAKQAKQRLQTSTVRLGKLGLWSCLWVCAICLVQQFPLATDLASRTEWPMLFRTREFLHKSPSPDSRLKVFAFDDLTLGTLSRSRLSFAEWTHLLEQISARSPKAIVIDSLFSATESTYDKSDPDLEAFVHFLNQSRTPIFAGAFPSAQVLPGRDQLTLTSLQYQIETYQDPRVRRLSKTMPLPSYDRMGNYIYGPVGSLQSAFSQIGHILAGPFPGTYLPVMRINQNTFLRHISLLPFAPFEIWPSEIKLEGVSLPVNQVGISIINYPEVKALKSVVKSLRVLLSSTADEHLNKITSADIVLILPLYFTGNVDFKFTPVGPIPGGLQHAAIMSSILSGSYIQEFKSVTLVHVFAGSLALVLGFALSPILLLSSACALIVAWSSVVLLSFCYFGILIPWLNPLVSACGVLLIWIVAKVNDSERNARFVHQAFDGYVKPFVIKELESHPERIPFEARERVLTVMFVDIVGFSLIVENQAPRIAFDSLKDIMDAITKVVHDHSGVVNKTLGDGLLCFFGYSFFEDKEEIGHAEQALLAGLEIQRQNVDRMLRIAEAGKAIFPLRIGIHTSAVYLGNVGSGERLDLTIIGNGVNFAKRLEGACSSHSVLLSQTTKELLEPHGQTPLANRRLVSIKHHREPIEAWEYDPFLDKPELRRMADDAFEHLAYMTRLEKRWYVPSTKPLLVKAGSGYGSLLNFSGSGLSFEFSEDLQRGQRLYLELKSSSSDFHGRLLNLGLLTLPLEVRWVREVDGRRICGAKIIELDDKKLADLMDVLCRYCGQEGQNSGEQSFGS